VLGAQPDNLFVAFLLRWHGIGPPGRGAAGLRRALRRLQDVPLPFSDLESPILAVRVRDYSPMLIDELFNDGEFVWQGSQSLGQHDGYVSVFAREAFPLLGRITVLATGSREQQIRSLLLEEGAADFERISRRLGGFPDELLRALWRLVWSGEICSDSMAALRARRGAPAARYRGRPGPRYAARRRLLPGAAGRWSLLSGPDRGFAGSAERELAGARQLLDRCGIACARTVPEIDRMRPALEALERRGEAVRTRLLCGEDGVEWAAPGAADTWRAAPVDGKGIELAAADPANPFGTLLPWPGMRSGYRPRRAPGARVLIYGGRLVGYLERTGRRLQTPLDLDDLAPVLPILRRAAAGGPVYIEAVDERGPYDTPWHRAMVDAGFSPSPSGYLLRGSRS